MQQQVGNDDGGHHGDIGGEVEGEDDEDEEYFDAGGYEEYRSRGEGGGRGEGQPLHRVDDEREEEGEDEYEDEVEEMQVVEGDFVDGEGEREEVMDEGWGAESLGYGEPIQEDGYWGGGTGYLSTPSRVGYYTTNNDDEESEGSDGDELDVEDVYDEDEDNDDNQFDEEVEGGPEAEELSGEDVVYRFTPVSRSRLTQDDSDSGGRQLSSGHRTRGTVQTPSSAPPRHRGVGAHVRATSAGQSGESVPPPVESIQLPSLLWDEPGTAHPLERTLTLRSAARELLLQVCRSEVAEGRKWVVIVILYSRSLYDYATSIILISFRNEVTEAEIHGC